MTRAFPIMACRRVKSVPWELAERARERLQWSHGRSLESLAERGGLLPVELVAALENLTGRAAADLDRRAAEERLIVILERENGANAWKS